MNLLLYCMNIFPFLPNTLWAVKRDSQILVMFSLCETVSVFIYVHNASERKSPVMRVLIFITTVL